MSLPEDESIEVHVNAAGFAVPEGLVERAVRLVLRSNGLSSGEISITFLSDEAIQAMNREYLSEDRPTDVISFSLGDPGGTLGDVYVGFDQAARQASDLGVVLQEELVRLAIHGALHVLGHDHPAGAERAEGPMFTLQEQLLREVLGVTPSSPASSPSP